MEAGAVRKAVDLDNFLINSKQHRVNLGEHIALTDLALVAKGLVVAPTLPKAQKRHLLG